MADPIETQVADDARAVIQFACNELKAVLDGLDTSLAETHKLQAQLLRNTLAPYMPELPAADNVRPIRAKAV